MLRWLIIANLSAALLIWISTPSHIQARRALATATYEEFQKDGVLVERPSYDIKQKLRMLAGGDEFMILGFHLAAGMCLFNASALSLVLWKTKK